MLTIITQILYSVEWREFHMHTPTGVCMCSLVKYFKGTNSSVKLHLALLTM